MIGVAGGVGPFAGIDLTKKIMEETKAGHDQEHLSVILASMPGDICDRTRYLEGLEKVNPAYALSRVLGILDAAGATVAAIPCNTAHAPAIFGVIREELDRNGCRLVLLNMIEEVTGYLLRHFPGKKVGVLSTTGTWKSRVYQDAFTQAGIAQVKLEETMQELVHSAIYHPDYGIKSIANPVHEQARNILLQAAGQLIGNGAGVILLGCTELPLAITETRLNDIPVVDANRVLARSLIRFEAPDKLKEIFI